MRQTGGADGFILSSFASIRASVLTGVSARLCAGLPEDTLALDWDPGPGPWTGTLDWDTAKLLLKLVEGQ